MIRLKCFGIAMSIAVLAHVPAGFAQSKSGTVAKAMPATVTVLGKTLSLKEQKGGGAGEPFIAEYIPKDQTWDNWTTMYATRFMPGANADPRVAAQATAKNVIDRKSKGDPLANAAVFQANDGKSVSVDFLVSSEKPEFLEHNVFKFMKAPNGLISQQIARRIYGGPEQKVQDFIKEIPKVRNDIFKEIVREDLPKRL